MRPLSNIERDTLLAFAKANGRTWKGALMRKWRSDERGATVEQTILRQLRNSHGPNWLYSNNNNPITKELQCLKSNSHSSPSAVGSSTR